MRIKRSIPVSALCILLALSLTSCISVRKVSDEEIRAGFDAIMTDLAAITGQKPIVCKAKKSVANFKIGRAHV